MALLPEQYRLINPDEWPMDKCPVCEGEYCHPREIGRNYVGVHQCWYHCDVCRTKWAIRYDTKDYSNHIIVDIRVPDEPDFRPACTMRNLLRRTKPPIAP